MIPSNNVYKVEMEKKGFDYSILEISCTNPAL